MYVCLNELFSFKSIETKALKGERIIEMKILK